MIKTYRCFYEKTHILHVRSCKLQYQHTDLLHEDEHSLSVLLPLVREVTLMRVLITAQEYGQFKTVCVQVTKIIHT